MSLLAFDLLLFPAGQMQRKRDKNNPPQNAGARGSRFAHGPAVPCVSPCPSGARAAGSGALSEEMCVFIPPTLLSPMPFALGLILRRCTLDEEGIAYWESPTYIKCVSIDYRNIQMMVRHIVLSSQLAPSPLTAAYIGREEIPAAGGYGQLHRVCTRVNHPTELNRATAWQRVGCEQTSSWSLEWDQTHASGCSNTAHFFFQECMEGSHQHPAQSPLSFPYLCRVRT